MRASLGTLGACLLGVALMLPGVTEPYGGFIAFSEAWYTLIAKGFDGGSLLLPEVVPGRPDFNLPPLFAWLLHLSFQVLGPSELAARLVAIAGAVVAIAATARVGGAAAAVLLASSPAFVLIARNVQPDGWSIALAVAAYAAWRGGRAGLSAALFGLALMAKPTVLLLPFALAVGATIERRGPGWVGRRHILWAALAAAPSIAWTGLQLLLHREAFLAGLRHGGGAFELPGLSLLGTLLQETVFAGFPVLLLAPIGVVRSLRDATLRPPAWILLVGLAIFVPMHYHGYYLAAYLPAAAVLVAPLVAGRRLLLAALVTLNAVAALLMLGGHGLGRSAVHDIARQAPGATFLMSPAAHDGYWTLIELYAEPASIVTDDCVTATDDVAAIVFPAPPGVEPDVVGNDRPRGLALAGRGLSELPVNPHRLAWGGLSSFAAGSNGLVDAGVGATVGALRVPPGARVCPAGGESR